MSDDTSEHAEHRDMSEEGKDVFTNLLSQVLVFGPEQRFSVEAIVKYFWFSHVNYQLRQFN